MVRSKWIEPLEIDGICSPCGKVMVDWTVTSQQHSVSSLVTRSIVPGRTGKKVYCKAQWTASVYNDQVRWVSEEEKFYKNLPQSFDVSHPTTRVTYWLTRPWKSAFHLNQKSPWEFHFLWISVINHEHLPCNLSEPYSRESYRWEMQLHGAVRMQT